MKKYKEGDEINGIKLIKRYKGERKQLFKCHCGKEFLCRVENIFRGHSKSCGCLINYNRFNDKKKSILNYVLSKMIYHMKRRKIECKINRDELISIIKSPCHYCGDIGGNISFNKTTQEKGIKYNGLDRIDSSIGYIEGNVVSCCKKCNWAKNDMNIEDFHKHIEKIYLFNKGKNEKDSSL